MPRGIRLFVMIVLLSVWALSASCQRTDNPRPTVKKAVPVQTLEIRPCDLPLVVEAVGRLTPNREVTLSAEVGGVIAGYTVDVGDKVEAGQVLVKINHTDYQLALAEALAGLAAAQAGLEAAAKAHQRARHLLPRKVISEDTFEKSEAEFKAAQASVTRVKALVDIAAQRLKKTRVAAPFAGLVAARLIELGQNVAPGTPLLSLADLSLMRVKVNLAEADYVQLDRDDPVSIMVEVFPEKSFTGKIDRIGIKADPMTNTFGVELLVGNPNLILKAGLSARVRLTTGLVRDAVLAPQYAILYRENREEVFVLAEGDKAEKRTLTLGRKEGSLVQILRGLSPGDKLIVSGGQYLAHGDKVKVTSPAKPKTP